MKIFLLSLAFVVAFGSAFSQQGEKLLLEVEFETYFDNKEYAQCGYSGTEFDFENGTDFAARLAPQLAWEWSEKNSLHLGASLVQPFGQEGNSLFSTCEPIVFYEFSTAKVTAAAGIFPRSLTHIDSYSTAFFSDDYLFFEDLQRGMYGAYNSGESFIEAGIDWLGQKSETTREHFRLFSAARKQYDHLYFGYNMVLNHFAAMDDLEQGNVVDAILINPAVGVRFNAYFDFDVEVGLLQSLQRDRTYGDGWLSPQMGNLGIEIARGGFYLDEQLYFGDNINPLFFGFTSLSGEQIVYGRELYPSDGFFRTEENIYNRAAIGYAHSFFRDTVGIKAEFVTHYDGVGLGTQQLVEVAVKIGKGLYDSEKH